MPDRDKRQFANPDTLDITRQNTVIWLSARECLGAPLARLEAQIAINALLRTSAWPSVGSARNTNLLEKRPDKYNLASSPVTTRAGSLVFRKRVGELDQLHGNGEVVGYFLRAKRGITDGVVNAANILPGVGPGGLATVFGANLTDVVGTVSAGTRRSRANSQTIWDKRSAVPSPLVSRMITSPWNAG